MKYDQYPLYDAQAGEEENPYTTAYFAVLIDVILSRCRTSGWFSNDQATPLGELGRLSQSLTLAGHSSADER